MRIKDSQINKNKLMLCENYLQIVLKKFFRQKGYDSNQKLDVYNIIKNISKFLK